MQSIFFPQIKYKKKSTIFHHLFPFHFNLNANFLPSLVCSLNPPARRIVVVCLLFFAFFLVYFCQLFASLRDLPGMRLDTPQMQTFDSFSLCVARIFLLSKCTNKNNKTKYSIRKNCAAFLCFFYVSRVCYRTPFVTQKKTHVKCQMLCEKYYCCLPVLVTF